MDHFWKTLGSGCGLVGRAVASEPRGPQFERSHQQALYNLSFIKCQLYWEDKNKGKEAGIGPILNR